MEVIIVISKFKGKTYEEIYGKVKALKILSKKIGQKRSEETKEKIRKALIGRKIKPESIRKRTETMRKMYKEGRLINPRLGKHLSIETKMKISNSNKGKHHSEESKKKMSESRLKGLNEKRIVTPNKGKKLSEEHKEKLSIIHKGKHYSQKTEFKKGHKFSIKIKEKCLIASRKAMTIKPNKPEQQIIKLIKENNLPFNYVGDGKIWFRGQNHSFNPDFLSKNPKHIIEVFGDYWHNLPNVKKRDKERLTTYKRYGYKPLVLWEHELKDTSQVLNKIKEFIGGKKNNLFVTTIE